MSEPIKNRYEFVILFDVENGNPNGDPDASNMPRVDPETGLGLVTDVCLKRKIRNYVETVKEDEAGWRIYVKDGVPLNRSDNEGFLQVGIENAAGIKPEELKRKIKAKKDEGTDVDRVVRDFMCLNFFDIRTFGAVMTTMVKGALNCGQVRGPVQLGFARSVEPIVPQEVTITRVAITTEADAEKKGTEMGRKYMVPYGLYRCEGYVSANLARKTTGFSDEDLELLWQAILNMFENDRSAARGKMAVRDLIVFKHDSELGCAPAWKLFETVKITRSDPKDTSPARSYQDYTVTVDEAAPAARLERPLTAEEDAAMLALLPPERRERLERLRQPEKRREPLCAYLILRHALWEQYRWRELPPIRLTSLGKPYFPDYPHIQFNLSHTDGAVVCAVSSAPVGVDLERSRPPADTILHYYHFTEGRDFWEMWVHREAIAKYHGRGFAALAHWDEGLERGVVCRPLALLAGYYAALATAAPCACSIHSVEVEEIARAAMRR